MSCDNNENLTDSLCGNIGRVVTIFTESGGASGCGFTGLLVKVDCGFVKLITEFPAAPTHPFGMNIGNRNFRNNRCRDEFGTVVIIPIAKIVSLVFNEI